MTLEMRNSSSLRSPSTGRFPTDRRSAKRPTSADRRKFRMNGPCAAFVQGVDASGHSSEILLSHGCDICPVDRAVK